MNLRLNLFSKPATAQARRLHTYIFAGALSLALIISSLLSIFVPNISAAVTISTGSPVEGSYWEDCNNGSNFSGTFDLFDDAYEEAPEFGEFSAEYQVNDGEWHEMESYEWDIQWHVSYGAMQTFSAWLNCEDYEAFTEYTFQMRGTTPNGTVYSDETTFSIGPVGTPEFQINVNQEVSPGLIRIDSLSNSSQYIDGSVDLPEDFEFSDEYGAPMQFQINGNGFNDVENLSIDGASLAFTIDFIEQDWEDGIHELDFRLYENFTGHMEDFSYTLVIGDISVPMISLNEAEGSSVTLTEDGQDISGSASIYESSLNWIIYNIDGGEPFAVTLTGGSWGSDQVEFDIYDLLWFNNLNNGQYDLNIIVNYGDNQIQEFTYQLSVEKEITGDPEITINNLIDDRVTLNESPLIVSGSATVPNSNISSITITIPGILQETLSAVDGSYDEDTEEFEFNLDPFNLLEGTYAASISAQATNNTSTVLDFDIEIDQFPEDNSAPDCGTTWYNLPSPVYEPEFSYTGITCSDENIISGASWRVYHYIHGELATGSIDAPDDGVFDESTEEFSFTAAIPDGPNRDGGVVVDFYVHDQDGNTRGYFDPLVVDYADQTSPVLSIQVVSPDPLADPTPTITGTCRDDAYRETNSLISDLAYRINGGSYVSIPPLDGEFDASREKFSHTLDELEPGSYTVDVRCRDAASNSAVETLSFDIEEPDAEIPGVLAEHVEEFIDHTYQDLANSDLIWGNGKLRLAEDISVARTPLDTEGYRNRYADDLDYNEYRVEKGVSENTVWYVKRNNVARLNTETEETVQMSPSDFGLDENATSTVGDLEEIEHEGKKYLFVAHNNGLTVYNLSDNTGSFTSSFGGIGTFVMDQNRGRLGMWHINTAVPNGNMHIAYLDLNGTPDNFSDDTITPVPLLTAGMTGEDVVRIFESPVENEYYVSVYNNGLFRWNDNNTPTNFSDDQGTRVTNHVLGAYGITFDRENNLIFGTAGAETGELYVVVDDGDEPYDNSDDTVVKLATIQQLGYNDVFGLTYLEGANGVGDQIFVQMEDGNPVYLNFNDTYLDPYDDTFIELNIDNGIRPSDVTILVNDYNTLYANIDRQGLHKVTLNRAWKTSGSAVALPPRPADTILIDNFTADATTIAPIAYIPSDMRVSQSDFSRWMPQAMAQASPGVMYEVSNDDGVTWIPVSLGELQKMANDDYRLQFRITMTPVDGSSPVVNSYTLQYGAYTSVADPEMVSDFAVSVSPAEVEVGESFTINLKAVDELGFTVPSYNGVVLLQLLDENDADQSSALSITQLTIIDGVGTATSTFVNKAGTFTIVGENEDADGQSNEFIVHSPEDNTGDDTNDDDDDEEGGSKSKDDSKNHAALSFTASDYTVCANDTVTLRWASNKMTSATLNGEGIGVDGTRERVIAQTTEFRLIASGPDGSRTSTLTITVDPNEATCATSGIFPVPISDGTVPGADPSDPFNTEQPGEGGESETTNTSGDNNAEAESDQPTLTVSNDGTYLEGEKVTVRWEAEGADGVTVDYLGGETGQKGSFQFIARETRTVTIRAFKHGDYIEKVITIEVKKLPLGLGSVLPEVMLPITAAAIRYGGITWLSVLGIVKLLSFFKRKPDDEIETSWVSDILKQFQIALWVISPITLLLSFLAAGVLGGPWLIGILILCLLITLRHAVQWSKTWVNRPVAG